MILVHYLSKTVGGRERQASYLISYLKSKGLPFKSVKAPNIEKVIIFQTIIAIYRLTIAQIKYKAKSTYIFVPSAPKNLYYTLMLTLPYILYAIISNLFGHKTVFRIAYTVEYPLYETYIPKRLLEKLTFHSITSIKQSENKGPKIVSILNGVDIKTFYPLPYSKKKDKFTIGYIGRFRPEKNIGLIVKAFAKLPKNIRADSELYLIGYDTSSAIGNHTHDYLLSKVNSLKINSKVHFLPLIPFNNKREIRETYNKLHVSILPSTYEGTSNAIMESIACGVPTISFRYTQGIREVLRDCPSWFFEELTSESIAKTMEAAYKEYKKSYVNECTKCARNNLSLNKALSELVKLLQ